jgi:mycofactocin precursor
VGPDGPGHYGALMDETTATDTSAPTSESEDRDDSLLADELLVEEISIDGMCGVY